MRNRRTASSSSALLRHVETNLEQRCGVGRGDRVLVAVSGGADSVALFLLLQDLAPRLRLELHLAHFDHGLRDSSAADAAWVAELAHTHGVPLYTRRWDTPRPGEAAARTARHAFLRDTARAHACAAIALAHHREDQMETILLRLGRGVGLRGALGMAWRRTGQPAFVRPLLECTRDELRAFLTARGADWREDPTNLERGPVRNRLRHEVLPALDAVLGPRWHAHWSATWTDLRAVWTWLDALGADLLQRAAEPAPPAESGHPPEKTAAPESRRTARRLRIDILRTADEPVLRAALQRWTDAAPEGASRAQLDDLVHLVQTGQSGSRVELAGGFAVTLEQGFLACIQFEIAAPSAAVNFESTAVAPGDALAAVARPGAGRSHGTREKDEAHVAADGLTLPLRLRAARTGDRIQLLGAPGRRPVARVLQDHHVPRRERAGWPVVEDAAGVLVWMPGVGVAEPARVGPNTLSALRLRVAPASGAPAAPDRSPGLPESRVAP